MKFSSTHEWMVKEGTVALIGISEYAADELGDIVFIQLPEVGDRVEIEEAFAEVESVKAVSPIISPVSGVITEINEKIIDNPELVNANAHKEWFVKVDVEEIGALMTESEYKEFIKK